jgi:hypothetical protein
LDNVCGGARPRVGLDAEFIQGGNGDLIAYGLYHCCGNSWQRSGSAGLEDRRPQACILRSLLGWQFLHDQTLDGANRAPHTFGA